MQAAARLVVERTAGPSGRTRISRLHSDAPLVLRPTHPAGAEPMPCWFRAGPAPARVSLAAGAGGPVGGDQLSLDVDVGPGATLILRAVAATVLLPGPHGRPSSSRVTVRVADGGTLVWLPGPAIAARRCDHQVSTHITLGSGARLLVREELILGRSGEQPGSVRQRLRVLAGDLPVLDQEIRLGPRAPGWEGSAVTGGRRAAGSLLLVDPAQGTAAADVFGADADAVVLPLSDTGTLITALAADAILLRRRLDTGLAALSGVGEHDETGCRGR
jgi:urease accessory protein